MRLHATNDPATRGAYTGKSEAVSTARSFDAYSLLIGESKACETIDLLQRPDCCFYCVNSLMNVDFVNSLRAGARYIVTDSQWKY